MTQSWTFIEVKLWLVPITSDQLSHKSLELNLTQWEKPKFFAIKVIQVSTDCIIILNKQSFPTSNNLSSSKFTIQSHRSLKLQRIFTSNIHKCHSNLPISFFKFYYYFFYFTILYLFFHTSTCICHGCTRVPHPEPLFHLPPHTIPLCHPCAPAPSFLYPALNLDWRFVSFSTFLNYDCHYLGQAK